MRQSIFSLMLTTACCLVAGLSLGLGLRLELVRGYAHVLIGYYFSLPLSLPVLSGAGLSQSRLDETYKRKTSFYVVSMRKFPAGQVFRSLSLG